MTIAPFNTDVEASETAAGHIASVISAGPPDRERWAAIADRDPLALPTHHPRWMDVVTGAGRMKDASRSYTFDDGVEAVLVMASGSRNHRGGPASLPLGWGIGGAVATEPLTGAHTAAILRDLRNRTSLRTTVWPAAAQGAAWTAGRDALDDTTVPIVSVPRRAHVLDISGGFDHVYQHKFNKKTRRYHRLALAHGVEVEASDDGRLAPVLHELIHAAVPRWAAQQNEPLWLARFRANRRDPLAKFDAITRGMGSRCRISVAWVDGRPAGAKLYLLDRNVESIWMALDPELGPATNAATALHVEMVSTACELGCGYVDFGESGQSKGLEDAKRRLGAVGIDYESMAIERLPISRVETAVKRLAKRAVGFRDVEHDLHADAGHAETGHAEASSAAPAD